MSTTDFKIKEKVSKNNKDISIMIAKGEIEESASKRQLSARIRQSTMNEGKSLARKNGITVEQLSEAAMEYFVWIASKGKR